MERRDFISFWNEAHTIIDDAVEKRDRSVAIYISPDSGMTLNVYPWPDEESLREALERGKITYNDYRKKDWPCPSHDLIDTLRRTWYDELG